MEQAFSWLQDTMVEITSQCKELGSIQLCDHATSCLQIVALEIQAFMLPMAMNQCTLAWFLIGWKMAWVI